MFHNKLWPLCAAYRRSNVVKEVIIRSILSPPKELSSIRTLFTKESLGINAYSESREKLLKYNTIPQRFKDEFKKKIESRHVPLDILVDDLKKYVHLVSNDSDEIELLWNALRLYQTQYEKLQAKSDVQVKPSYLFGPIVMRSLSHHNLPEYAIKFFEDKTFASQFNHNATYVILLDLLYECRMYGDVLRIYAGIREQYQAKNEPVINKINAIIFATYYRLNTPAHDELAFDMYKELKECDYHLLEYQKSIALVAAMRLRRDHPHESLEILSIHDDHNLDIRCVRMLSHLYLNQFEDIFRLLEMTIALPNTERLKRVPTELLQKFEDRLQENGDHNLRDKYRTILSELKQIDRISHVKNLDDVLCGQFSTKMSPFKSLKPKAWSLSH